ncbi:ATP synthase subunit B family protein [Alkaliphilus oremlandii]|uniref:Vacuolar-type H+-ATPase subunit H n=1 Tax=Alkaliphilus oremlandii (strain OhILAs) TaxID=350688 RepID=A8MHA1_ALKOO|nr:ATPase [Alkaliphilus oremlandii]ABW18988.1 vacuolar-type H+-ATPase subunit H [Alkaliphilus oremlandii OhILAs]
MSVLQLLEEIEDIIESGSSIPFAQKVLIDKRELLEIIKDIRIKLPDEVKQAQWIKEERQRILAEAQQEADTILEEANNHILSMIDQSEITRKANERAEEIIAQAQNSAKEMRLGAKDYVDSMLESAQENLIELVNTIKINRDEIKGMK